MRDWELIGKLCDPKCDLQAETLRSLLGDACGEIVRLNRIIRGLTLLAAVKRPGWDRGGRTPALAALRQATWEATQFLSYDDTREYVAAVLREVESDEP